MPARGCVVAWIDSMFCSQQRFQRTDVMKEQNEVGPNILSSGVAEQKL